MNTSTSSRRVGGTVACCVARRITGGFDGTRANGAPWARRATRAMILAAGLLGGAAALAATTPAISPLPLPLSASVAPNLFITIDDSGSMAWAHVPDTLIYDTAIGGLTGAKRGYKSVALNALYYDPSQKYTAPPFCTYDPTTTKSTCAPLTTSWPNALADGFDPASGTINLLTNYRPTASFQTGGAASDYAGAGIFPANGPALGAWYAAQSTLDFATPTTPGAAYYYNYVAGNPNCSRSTLDDNCYSIVRMDTQSAAQQQNFANWFSFFRTRHMAITASAALAMSDPTLASARVAWQAINSCKDFSGTHCQDGWGPFGTNPVAEPAIDNSIQGLSGQHLADFYNWLKFLPAAGGTPMRGALDRVGQYLLQAPTPNGPWGDDPKKSTSTNYSSCRANFHILLTDGQWNADAGQETNYCHDANGGGNGCVNEDSIAHAMPAGRAFVPNTPNATSVYYDNNASSLADIGFHYWATDLQPTLANDVPTSLPPATAGILSDADYWNPKYDPASWQHLVNYTVGLGLNANMANPPAWGMPGNTWGGPGSGYGALVAGTVHWPDIAVASDTDPAKVYDLWHLALDSHGQAFGASSAQDIQNAFHAFIGAAESAAAGASTAATSSSQLQSSTLLFRASFRKSDWSGLIEAIPLKPDPANPGNVVPTPPAAWTTDTSFAFPNPLSARKVVTWSGPNNAPAPAPVPGGFAFTSGANGGVAAAGYRPLPGTTAANTDAVVDWLVGDRTNEQTTANPNGTLRARTRLLGDIADSDPVFAYDDDYGWGVLPTAMGGGASYFGYLSGSKIETGRPKMLYVGANDGMLHGFNADTGTEVFAYVPNGVLNGIAGLSSPSYTHQFTVDGTPFVGDAYLGGTWRSVLVGLTGAGARSAFALDVTHPQNFATATGGNSSGPMWEIAANARDGTVLDSDLGYTIGQAVIAPLNDGAWYAIFGNGYQSDRQCPVLFLVKLSDGTVRKIDASSGRNYTAGVSGSPACTGPALNGLGSPALYDINGDGVPDVAYAGDQAGNLWRFDLTKNDRTQWSVPSNGIATIPFFRALAPPAGTPQPITAAPEIGPTQSGAGIMLYFGTGRFFATTDPADTTIESVYGVVDTLAAISAPIMRATLQAQTITDVAATATSPDGRIVSQHLLAAGSQGWYIDLNLMTEPGERVLSTPLLDNHFLGFSTLAPGQSSCKGGGGGYILEVNPFTGAGGGNGAYFGNLLKNGDGVLTSDPMIGAGFVRGLTALSNPAGNSSVTIGAGASGTATFAHGTGVKTGRTSWQEIVP